LKNAKAFKTKAVLEFPSVRPFFRRERRRGLTNKGKITSMVTIDIRISKEIDGARRNT
jgi:hypothetical protein